MVVTFILCRKCERPKVREAWPAVTLEANEEAGILPKFEAPEDGPPVHPECLRDGIYCVPEVAAPAIELAEDVADELDPIDRDARAGKAIDSRGPWLDRVWFSPLQLEWPLERHADVGGALLAFERPAWPLVAKPWPCRLCCFRREAHHHTSSSVEVDHCRALSGCDLGRIPASGKSLRHRSSNAARLEQNRRSRRRFFPPCSANRSLKCGPKKNLYRRKSGTCRHGKALVSLVRNCRDFEWEQGALVQYACYRRGLGCLPISMGSERWRQG
jgi:hypothetical protein